MTLFLAPIVEGQTEQGCVERLLQRVWHELLAGAERLQVVEPFRGHRDELVHPNGLVLTDTVSRALVKLRSKAKKDAEARPLVLILLDAEGDCPKALAPRLLEMARSATGGNPRVLRPGDEDVGELVRRRGIDAGRCGRPAWYVTSTGPD